jgi:hypothetical protein
VTIDGDEAYALLLGSCPSFAASGGYHRYVSSFEEADTADPYVRVGALAHHVIVLAAGRDLEEVGWLLAQVERVLAEGDADAVELVSLGLLEPLRNIVSHDDVALAADELASVLGPDATEVWHENEELWESAAQWCHRGARVELTDYDKVTNPELRRYLQAHKRRMSDGVLIGASDVVSYQRQVQGLSPVRPAGGPRVPWWAVALGLTLAALALVAILL